MTILITGHKGFIGSNLTKRFDDYIGVEQEECYKAFHEIDWSSITKIYHLGAISSTVETDINSIHHYNINYTLKLFEKAIEYKIPISYASSASVYGNSKTDDINPLNYYAMSKATVDYWVKDNIDKFVNIVGLRFFNVYGAGEESKGSSASIVHQFIKQAKEGEIRLFTESFKTRRDFVWVEDVIDYMIEEKNSGIYDVGTGKSTNVEELAKWIAEKYNAKLQYFEMPSSLKGKYQYFTEANVSDFKYLKVKEYINGL